MPFTIIRDDITRLKVDAIVNAANSSLLGGGGVDGAIHAAAGPELLAECRTLGGCPTGEAKITKAYRLPCKYVIHTVGPVWQGGGQGERELLLSCYRKSLELARAHQCKTVAFPLISSGAYGYPKAQALAVATEAIRAFLNEIEDDLSVTLAVFDRNAFQIGRELFDDIAQYIDDRYVAEHGDSNLKQARRQQIASEILEMYAPMAEAPRDIPAPKGAPKRLPPQKPEAPQRIESAPRLRSPLNAPSLEDALAHVDESFSQMVLRKINERGMTDVQCYKRANMDRKLFSKIRNNAAYKPSKPTTLAFAVALELPLDEARDLLMKAGFAFSRSSRSDIIVEYFIARGSYDIDEINAALFAFGQAQLGAL